MASVYSVSQVNSYIKNMFTQDFLLANLMIKGEVSNCKYHTSGHVYFTIKDKSAAMACVLFAGSRKGMNFQLKEGQNVIIEGSVNIYERDGKYQFYAKKVTLDGTGILYQRFEELKRELEEMGMFAEEYKKEIPSFAMKIGIVTAATGAAIRDIVNIAGRRNPFVQLYLYSAQVQGDGAKESIVQGIKMLDRLELDVLIVGRGGGSIEDLWAFNEECVARAIFECRTPVISAVGHEVDVTIADYVADMRAPTPSAAAELAVFDYELYVRRLSDYEYTLKRQQKKILFRYEQELKQYTLKLNYLNPANRIREQRQQLMDAEDRLRNLLGQMLEKKKHALALYAERLNGLSPLTRLSKGYAYVEGADGNALTKTAGAKKGDILKIQLKDGRIRAEVIGKERKKFRGE